jgi:N-acetylmuramoyl-L-alanine amidase
LFAQKVEDQFRIKARRNSRGVKQAGFVVLWRTTMPSVLIETGFLSSAMEEQFLASQEGQDLLASGIYRAFKEYKSEVESIN